MAAVHTVASTASAPGPVAHFPQAATEILQFGMSDHDENVMCRTQRCVQYTREHVHMRMHAIYNNVYMHACYKWPPARSNNVISEETAVKIHAAIDNLQHQLGDCATHREQRIRRRVGGRPPHKQVKAKSTTDSETEPMGFSPRGWPD